MPRRSTTGPASISAVIIGGAFAGDNNFDGCHGNNNDGRFLGGVQVGADYQFAPNWVLGIEGQYSWLGSNNNSVASSRAAYVYTNNERASAP